jgi:hypothetical protein
MRRIFRVALSCNENYPIKNQNGGARAGEGPSIILKNNIPRFVVAVQFNLHNVLLRF